MKRFEFSLDRLLKVKTQLERLAEMEQLRAREAVDRARGELQECRDQLNRISDRVTDSIGIALSPLQWASACDMTERLGVSIKTAEDAVNEAERRLAAAASERAQIATEVEALSTLRRQQWEQWRQEAQKADQEQLDQVGLRTWMRKNEAAGGVS